MQDLVADGGRLTERLRIAGELHDALGHHLTALTLNLEAALVRTDGAAHGDVETAQSLAREAARRRARDRRRDPERRRVK